MNIVYVVQCQHRFDKDLQKLVPVYDLSPAKEYGDLVELLGRGASPFGPESVLKQLHRMLQHYGPEDYLLLIGNPVLIGWAVAIAAHYCTGKVTCLQWSGKEKAYLPIEAKIF